MSHDTTNRKVLDGVLLAMKTTVKDHLANMPLWNHVTWVAVSLLLNHLLASMRQT